MNGVRVQSADVVSDADSLLADATRAQELDGDLRESRRWFEAAYQEGERAGDELVMARAALGQCGLWVHEHATLVDSRLTEARLRHVLSLIDPASALALRLRIRAASEADFRAGEHGRILAVLDEARAAQDPVAWAEALSRAHNCLLGPDHGARRRGLADEMVGVAARTGQEGHLVMGLLWLVADMFLVADPHVERRLGELRELLARRDHLAIGYVLRAMEVMLAIRAGRLAEAELLADECREHGIKVGYAGAEAWWGAQLVAIRWYQGRLPELLPTLTELVSSSALSPLDHSFTAACAVAAAQGGDYLTATRALASVHGRSLAELPRSSSWLVTMYGVVEAAHLLGDVSTSAQAYELLLPYADLPMMASLGIACFGSVHYALGVASMTTGHIDRAAGHLSEGLCRNFALGHWPAVIASRLRYAQVLERQGGHDEIAGASLLRTRADELAAKLAGQVAKPAWSGQARCTRHGARWQIELGIRSVFVEHCVGMLHLAVLIANPGTEIAAIDLVAGTDVLGQAARRSAMPEQQVLDRTAAYQYRQRLAQLREQADDVGGGDEPVDRNRSERDWLRRELSAGTRIGGRTRAFSEGGERARIAVGRSIRRALADIEHADADIGAHLRAAVHTGAKCWYRPV